MRVLMYAVLMGILALAFVFFAGRVTMDPRVVAVLTGILAIAFVFFVARQILCVLRRGMKGAGSPSLGAYLRSTPRSDREVRDAVDVALMGAVFCILGIFLPPLVLFGLVPLYYGARKLIHAGMGLGLADDPDARGP